MKLLFGDIVAINNLRGTKIATYTYDAWGNCTVGYLISDHTAADTNLFRYRGYIYDTETGFYWLRTRYYDPVIGSFINADSLLNGGDELQGYNMYAYCGNNPVMYVDPTGEFLDTIFDIFFIGWDIYNLCTKDGYKDWKNWVALGVDVAFATLPFFAGGGQVVKLANVADDISDFSKITVVGETMGRVRTVSQFVNATDNLYEGFKAYDKLSKMGKGGKMLAEFCGKASNVAWLYGQLRSGYQVVDIGIDSIRTIRSSSYIAERITIGIWKSRNFWKWLYHIDNLEGLFCEK